MRKSNKIVCDVVSGQVLYRFSGDHTLTVLTDNQIMLDAEDIGDIDHVYFDAESQQVQPKHTFESGAFVGDDFHIALPAGCLVTWQGETYTVDDGELQLLVDQAGRFLLTLHHPHYLAKELYIENPNLNQSAPPA